ncbi:DUF58 domain-containing protein [Cumulibacter manganitolerans]|uniref:DUF58 domain-containing protein n=1 Tax=Cumulibacter manganitolerans TaxID=1884992 RepID=UPI001885B094|nr:DUF58 domain-containing protein [Cumulibacter manganitolerans]
MGALVLGETDLLRVAIVILVVCVLTWLLSLLLRTRVESTISAHPPDVPVGTATTVRVATRVRRPLLPAGVVCHAAVSEDLTPTGHLAVAAARARAGITLAFTTAPRSRGTHTVGPLEVTMRDPLGLVTTRATGRERLTVLGLPRWHDVHPGWLRVAGALPRFLDSRADRGLEGEPEVGVREHRAEDGLRRIHWRTSARVGRLMTRLDEPQSDRTATIGYESRSRLHRGATYELALEVVASLGMALLRDGFDVRLVDSTGEQQPPGGSWDPASLLRFLALAHPTTAGAAPALPATDGPSILITTEAPAPASPPAGRVIVVEPPGQRVVRRSGVGYVSNAGTVADVLGTAPRLQVTG